MGVIQFIPSWHIYWNVFLLPLSCTGSPNKGEVTIKIRSTVSAEAVISEHGKGGRKTASSVRPDSKHEASKHYIARPGHKKGREEGIYFYTPKLTALICMFLSHANKCQVIFDDYSCTKFFLLIKFVIWHFIHWHGAFYWLPSFLFLISLTFGIQPPPLSRSFPTFIPFCYGL